MTPDPVQSLKLHDAISQRAADYFQRRRFGGWSDADQIEFDAWLGEAISHRVAYLRVEGIAARTRDLAALRPPKREQAPPVPARRIYRRWHALPLLAAASIALIAALGIPFVQSLFEPANRVFATNVGGRALIKFSDGTEVELNTDTAVRYRMTSRERIVWLDKGEAWFRVTHNAANPFAVVAGGHRITDLGTEFVVRNDPGALDVALLKGRAQLASENPGVPVAMLAPGDEAIATRISTTITKKTQQELSDELAWQRGTLVFRNTRLADAVRELNRYNETKLVIADPSIADVKFSIEIRNDNIAGFLELAQTVLNLRVDREGNEFLLSRGPREQSKKSVRVKRGT